MGNKPVRSNSIEKVGTPNTPTNSNDVSSVFSSRERSSTEELSGVTDDSSEFMDDADFIASFEIPREHLQNIREIGKGQLGVVHEAIWTTNAGETRVAAKTITSQKNNSDWLVHIQNELSVLGTLQGSSHNNVTQFIGACISSEPYIIVTELGLKSLREALHGSDGAKNSELTLDQVLQLAVGIAKGLDYLHANDIVHGSLTSNNVLLVSEDNYNESSVKLCDYGLQNIKTQDSASAAGYTSPEQFKSTARPCKPSDIFSFGILMYELLTGKVPYHQEVNRATIDEKVSKDPLFRPIPNNSSSSVQQLFRCRNNNEAHIVEMFVALMKDCWSHDPIERPSATEIVILLNDLIQKHAEPNYVSKFSAIQGKRHNAVFVIPDRLRGRDIELETVKDLLCKQDKNRSNTTRAILISGVSGIGKSALVKKLFADITDIYHPNKDTVTLVASKYDQYNSTGVPYSAILEALQQFIMKRIIIPGAKNKAIIKFWHKELKKALDSNVRLMTSVIPELEMVLGTKAKKKYTEPSSPEETKTRFTQAINALLKLAANSKHRLVMFLDDLQWADNASLEMLASMVKNPHIFFVGAYRSNEVGPEHPLAKTTLPMLRKECKAFELALTAPTMQALNEITVDVLRYHHNQEATLPLTELVYERSSGNPFFFTQYLVSLHANKLLYYLPTESRWAWDLAAIRDMGFTGDVAELMVMQLQLLSNRSQRILQLASCLGASFPFSTLQVMCENVVFSDGSKVGSVSEADLREIFERSYLQHARDKASAVMAEGGKVASSLDASTKIFKFAHDRIQQAAFLLFAEADKSEKNNTTCSSYSPSIDRVRHQIGQVLLKHTDLMQTPNAIFSIVVNMNCGKSIIAKSANALDELVKLAELNMDAAAQAIKTGDIEGALEHVRIGVDIVLTEMAKIIMAKTVPALKTLDDAHAKMWADSKYHDLCFKIILKAQNLEYNMDNIPKGDEHFEMIKRYAKNDFELTMGYKNKLESLEKEMKFKELLQMASTFLSRKGDKVDLLNVEFAQAQEAYQAFKEMVSKDDFACLKAKYTIHDSTQLPEFALLSQSLINAACLSSLDTAAMWITAMVMKSNIEKGFALHDSSLYSYAGLSFVFCYHIPDHELFRNVCETVMQHSNAYDCSLYFSSGYNGFARFVAHPFDETNRKVFSETLRQLVQAGAYSNAQYVLMTSSYINAISGPENLNELSHKFQKWIKFCTDMSMPYALLSLRTYSVCISLLATNDDGTAEREFLQYEKAVIEPFPTKALKMNFYIIKSFSYLILGNLAEATAAIEAGMANVASNAYLLVHDTYLYFLEAIVAIENQAKKKKKQEMEDASGNDACKKFIDERVKRLDGHAKFYETNFGTFYHFLVAHRARLLPEQCEDSSPAFIVDHYKKAAAFAGQGCVIGMRCFALEHLAQYLTEINKPRSVLLQCWWNAYSAYRDWRADRKTAMLDEVIRRGVPGLGVSSVQELEDAVVARVTTDPKIIDEFVNACLKGDMETVRRYLQQNKMNEEGEEEEEEEEEEEKAQTKKKKNKLFGKKSSSTSEKRVLVDVNCQSGSAKRTGLHAAAASGHLDVAEYLISMGADLRALDSLESSPIHYACSSSDAVKGVQMVDLLCEAFKKQNSSSSELRNWLNARNVYGSSALFSALDSKQAKIDPSRYKIAERLLAHGADVNTKRINSDTIIHKRAALGDVETVRFLLNFFSDSKATVQLSKRNDNGVTAAMVAAQEGKSEVLELLLGFVLARSQEEGGSASAVLRAIGTPDMNNRNILHVAMQKNDAKLISILTKHTLGDAPTVLSVPCVQLIFEMLNRKDSVRGYTPLAQGILGGSHALALQLLDLVVEILKRIKKNNRQDIIALLLKKSNNMQPSSSSSAGPSWNEFLTNPTTTQQSASSATVAHRTTSAHPETLLDLISKSTGSGGSKASTSLWWRLNASCAACATLAQSL